MSSFRGSKIKLRIFGQSHSQCIGMTIQGIPADFAPDMGKLNAFMQRRAPGKNEFSSSRCEKDIPEFTSGLSDGKTCGEPVTAIIQNTDIRPGDYDELKYKPRPGHADYTAFVKYGEAYTGGGQFSGRMTAPLCVAGGLCLQILEQKGIKIISRIAEIGGVADDGELLSSTAENDFPTVSAMSAQRMKEAILAAKLGGDSLGGIIECKVLGVPAGVGDALFDGMESRIASLIFAIPAVKGIEFGAGFNSARMKGFDNNDSFYFDKGKILTETNNCGGILGGITNGMQIVFRAAIKPTPSISREQRTVDLRTGKNTTLKIHGRHDACIVPRAVPCVEAAAAIAVLDALSEM